jgi:hypothetical protein
MHTSDSYIKQNAANRWPKRNAIVDGVQMPSSNIISKRNIDQSRPTLLYYSIASYVHSTSQLAIDLFYI